MSESERVCEETKLAVSHATGLHKLNWEWSCIKEDLLQNSQIERRDESVRLEGTVGSAWSSGAVSTEYISLAGSRSGMYDILPVDSCL